MSGGLRSKDKEFLGEECVRFDKGKKGMGVSHELANFPSAGKSNQRTQRTGLNLKPKPTGFASQLRQVIRT